MKGRVFDDIILTMMEITLLMTLLILVLNDFELVMDTMCKEEFFLKLFQNIIHCFVIIKKRENDDLDPDFFDVYKTIG